MGKVADLRERVLELEPGVPVFMLGVNGGTLRNVMHSVWGAGNYAVRAMAGGYAVARNDGAPGKAPGKAGDDAL